VGHSVIHFRVSLGWWRALTVTILVLCNGFGVRMVAADDEKSSSPTTLFESKFAIGLGGFFPNIDSTFSLNPSSGGSGQDISLEDDLGISDTSSSAWIRFIWRFQPRHQFQAEWFQLNRDGETSAQGDFTIGDTTAFAGAGLSSKFDLNLGRLSYGYSILRDEKLDLSFLVGAHVLTTKATVTAAGTIAIDGGPVFNGSSTESSSTFTFPLPHLGGQFTYRISPKWTAQATVLAFALEVNEYNGTLLEVDAHAAYQLSKHFGIGAGLKYFNLNVQAQKSRGGAEFDYQFLGPAVFGFATF